MLLFLGQYRYHPLNIIRLLNTVGRDQIDHEALKKPIASDHP